MPQCNHLEIGRKELDLQAFKTEMIVDEDGSLNLQSLPFRAGERVEVIVRPACPAASAQQAYPLRGTPYRYDEPTAPVADTDWKSTR